MQKKQSQNSVLDCKTKEYILDSEISENMIKAILHSI